MRQLSLKTIILLLIPVVLAIGSLAFWQPVLSYVIELSFESYCRDCFDTELDFTKVVRDKQTITFTKPTLSNEEDIVQLEAEELVIAYEPRFFQREIDLDVTVVDPNINLEKVAPALASVLGKMKAKWGFFKINHRIKIQNGIFDIDGLQKAHFTVDHDFVAQKQMKVVIRFAGAHQDENSLTIALNRPSKDNFTLDLEGRSLSFQALVQTIGSLLPSIKDWDVQDGVFDGHMQFTFSDKSKRDFTCQAELKNLSFLYKPLEVKGFIPEAYMDFSNSVGNVKLLDDARFLFEKDGLPFLEFKHLLGQIDFPAKEMAHVVFDGICSHHEQAFTVHVDGDTKIVDGYHKLMNLTFDLDNPIRKNIAVKVLSQWFESKCHAAEIEINNFGFEEFDVFKQIFGGFSPAFNLIVLKKGTVDAVLFAPIEDSEVQKLNLVSLNGEQLVVEFVDLQIEAEADHVYGTFNADLFANNVVNSLNAEITVKNACLKVLEPGESFPLFTHIDTKLNIDQGRIRQSAIKGKFLGLEGEMGVNSFASDKIATLEFTGYPDQLLALVPEKYRAGLDARFANDEVALSAFIKRDEKRKVLEGTLESSFGPKHSESISFGFDILNTSEMISANWGKREWSIGEFTISQGWIEAADVRLEKYIEPFLFPEGDLHLSGMGSFQGMFDDKELVLSYDMQNILLENEDFAAEIKSIVSEDQPKRGVHHFDLITGEDYGFVSLRNGSYFEKNNGLLFTDINADIQFKNHSIAATGLETYCNGVYFGGSALIDMSSPEKEVFSVDFRLPIMKGKVSQVQHLFSHFKKPMFFLKCPIEGNVFLREEANFLRFEFSADDYVFNAKLRGSLTDGAIQSENFDVNIQELTLDFDYDHLGNKMEIKDIQGTLLVGKPDRVEEYLIAGDHFCFTNFAENEASFDVWVGDKKRDIIRLVGNLRSPLGEGQSDYVAFQLDHALTHFGDVHPKVFHLTLKNWSEIDLFQLELDFQLNTLLHDLQRFSRTGFLFLSRGLLKELNEVKTASGDFNLKFVYEADESELHYHMLGRGVRFGASAFEKVLLLGQKRGKKWSIDQFQLDDISLAADFVKEDAFAKINFLGLRVGSALLIGMEGEYINAENAINGKVNLLESDLSKLLASEKFSAFSEKLAAKGQLKATGQVRIELEQGASGWKVDSLLDTSFSNLQINGLQFRDVDHASFHLISDRGAILRQFNTAIQSPSEGPVLADLAIDKAEYDLTSSSFFVEGMRFKVSSQKLPEVVNILQTRFPETFTETLAEPLRNLKSEGELVGNVNLDVSSPYYAIKLGLDEGTYKYKGQEHELSYFVMDVDPCEFKLLTRYHYNRHPLWLMVNSKSPTLDFGRLILADYNPEAQNPYADYPPLVCYWRDYPGKGWAIETAEGNFSGLNVHLSRVEEEQPVQGQQHLIGDIKLNMHLAASLLPPELAKKVVEWEIGDGYLLSGKWKFIYNETKKENDIYFSGDVEGHNCEFKGYQFYALKAQANYTPDSLDIVNITLHDPSGVLQAEQIHMNNDGNDVWTLNCPLIALSEFRPSLLRQTGSLTGPFAKPFVIKQLEVQNLHGILGKAETMKGEGWLYFTSPHKKNFNNPLFAIPAEIISRIGLDLTVLSPVIGTIFYEIKNERVELTKFKDIYSEGKLSKFYLPTNTLEPSYVDFNGNLNINVRMKQYNLLFKIAELLTVNISGTLAKPTYSLQNQQK